MTMVDEEQNSRIDAAAAPVNGQPPQSPEPGAAEAPGSYPPAAQPPAGQPPAAGVQTAGAQPERVDVVGIRFRDAGKIYYFKPGELELKPGER